MTNTHSHTLYLDDSGTKEYSDSRQYGSVGNTRYFVFGGFCASLTEASRLAEAVAHLKRQTFGRPDVEIKSNWLRMPRDRERRYLSRFSISDGQLTAFVDSLYSLVASSSVEMIATVVDKLHMQEDYGQPWYAPAVAYEAVLQRVQMTNSSRGHAYSVTIDDMSGATPHRNQYKDNLRRQHTRLKTYGSSLKRGFLFPHLRGDIRFLDSANSHLLQIADIVAYNVYRQFVQHGALWESGDSEGKLPTYEYLERFQHRFMLGPNNRIQGYGIVKFPMRTRKIWVLPRETAPQKE